MKKLKLAFRKTGFNDPDVQGDLTHKRFVSVAWFQNKSFIRDYDEKQRKIFIEKYLKNKVERHDIPDKWTIEEEEEVVVTMQGRHSLDNALLHEDIEIPNHLVDKKSKSSENDSKKVNKW